MPRSLGCFGATLFAILFALGVTETLKRVGPLERTLGLSAAVLASAAVAGLREKLTRRPQASPAPPAPPSGAVPPRPRPSPPPPPTPPPPSRVDDAILASRRQAILFRQIVPPNHDPRHLSFFGGAPIAPAGMAWPEAIGRDGAATPNSIHMQIDCAAVPADGRLGLMPDRGVLHVFLESGANAFRVLYHPDPSDDWRALSPPATLGPVFDARRAWERSPLWPKWPFDPVVVHGGPLPTDEEALQETYAWPGTVDVASAIRAIPGAVVPLETFSATLRGESGRRRPFDAFPQDWGAVRITTGLIAEHMKRDVDRARRYRFPEMTDDEFAALVDAVSAERRAWEERAGAADAADAVPPAERDRFWEWMTERDWLTRLVIPDAATLSVEASLARGADAAARVPADAVARVRYRHALAVETDRGLHVNTPDRMLAAPVDVQGTIDERVREFLLLLELSSSEGIGHEFGEGVFQFWIRPADLAARRFDRVELSTTAY